MELEVVILWNLVGILFCQYATLFQFVSLMRLFCDVVDLLVACRLLLSRRLDFFSGRVPNLISFRRIRMVATLDSLVHGSLHFRDLFLLSFFRFSFFCVLLRVLCRASASPVLRRVYARSALVVALRDRQSECDWANLARIVRIISAAPSEPSQRQPALPCRTLSLLVRTGRRCAALPLQRVRPRVFFFRAGSDPQSGSNVCLVEPHGGCASPTIATTSVFDHASVMRRRKIPLMSRDAELRCVRVCVCVNSCVGWRCLLPSHRPPSRSSQQKNKKKILYKHFAGGDPHRGCVGAALSRCTDMQARRVLLHERCGCESLRAMRMRQLFIFFFSCIIFRLLRPNTCAPTHAWRRPCRHRTALDFRTSSLDPVAASFKKNCFSRLQFQWC